MSMELNGVSSVTANQQVSTQSAVKTSEDKVSDKAKDTEQVGVTYEKGMNTGEGLYSINKMSQTDRSAIVNQLKAETEKRQNELMSLVQKTLAGQVGAYGKATGDDFWRTLAGGKFTVDAATKAQAQKDISEDGYWGVKQTSQRLFDFASALAGDDVEQMKKMQAAMEKGYKQATKTWGKELPSISRDTLNAANRLFENYYASKGVTEDTETAK